MPLVSTNKFILWKKKQLIKGGDDNSLYYLVDSCAGISKSEINSCNIDPEKKINFKKSLSYLEKLWDEYLQTSIPIQYLAGYCYWRDLKLEVSNKVLIPRPETELIVDIISEKIKRKFEKKIFADLGTGSGAISVALALANPQWEGLATDIDKSALDIASRNFAKYSKNSNLKFHCGSWWDPLVNFKGEIDFAVANPPYIPDDVYEKLPKEVKDFEPKIALCAGQDGLEHIKKITQNAPLYLKEKGLLLIENHYDQGSKVKRLFIENGFTDVKVLKDLSGIGRFTIGRYK